MMGKTAILSVAGSAGDAQAERMKIMLKKRGNILFRI